MVVEVSPKGSSMGPVRIESVGGLLRWWRRELIGMLPQGVRDQVLAADTTFVTVNSGGLTLLGLSGGKLASVGEIPGSLSSAEPGRPVANGSRATALRGANTWLMLSAEDVLLREATLPLAAEEATREALTFELDRLTPFAPEKVWFGYQVTRRDEAEGLLTVRLAVALRDRVEPLVDALRGLGARVAGVGLLDEAAHDHNAVNLLPLEHRDPPLLGWRGMATRALGALAICLLAAVFVYPIWLKREAVISLLPRVEQARSAASVSGRLASEIETLAKEHNFLLEKKHAQASMASLVEELSRSLPDNTWVQQLEVKQGAKTREVQISGESGSSSALVELLEKTGLFANATFKSPLTKGTNPNTERYLLSAELKPRDMPVAAAQEAASQAQPAGGMAPSAPQGAAK